MEDFGYIMIFGISFLNLETALSFEDKREPQKKKMFDEEWILIEKISNEMLDNSDFDYITLAQILTRINPDGW